MKQLQMGREMFPLNQSSVLAKFTSTASQGVTILLITTPPNISVKTERFWDQNGPGRPMVFTSLRDDSGWWTLLTRVI